jgi:hypothetical protein
VLLSAAFCGFLTVLLPGNFCGTYLYCPSAQYAGLFLYWMPDDVLYWMTHVCHPPVLNPVCRQVFGCYPDNDYLPFRIFS